MFKKRDESMKSSKKTIYLVFISIIPLIISLILTPYFSFSMRLLTIIVPPMYLLVVLLVAIRYAKKDIVSHSALMGRITTRTVYALLAVFPIGFLLLGPLYGISYMDLDYIVLLLYGINSVLDLTAIILYKLP
jgi:small-conductance mechanosensitive channel